ncbi:MAG: toxin-antitoxin system YwqK family antitoxin [Pirellulales bacterium]
MFANAQKWIAGMTFSGAVAIGGLAVVNAAPPYIRQSVAGVQTKPQPTPAPLIVSSNGDDSLPQVEPIQERFPNGKVRKQRYVVLDSGRNYVNHGPFVEYSQSGRKIAAGDFNMGRYEGTWVRWYEPKEGSLFETPTHKLFQQPFMSEVQLHEGKLNGTWTVYDGRKLKVSVWNFENGKRNGKSTWFYPDGRRAREVDYMDGVINGKAMAWTNAEQVTEDWTYIQGRRLVNTIHWHRPDVKAAEGKTLYAKDKTESTYDWWSANISYTTDSEATVNEKVGVWTWWHANGQKSCEGEFVADLAEGHWSFWHQNGLKKTEGTYENGKRIGTWATWREDGSFVGEKTPDDSKTVVDDQQIPSDSAEVTPPNTDDYDVGSTARLRTGRLQFPNRR